ncbi:transient receptor potential cation channel protein painless-like [Agrilus planipennis]|uniref:Transient receptor potential cation channel protein painless-like n=1 Tax=Agrilus planipennis TaxID=224129 RepID=A0A1W4XIN7_AGRPL|nr:transient receptor potential cation channel protein painless-like [Agrilus planipennis]
MSDESLDDELKSKLFSLLRTNEDKFVDEFVQIPKDTIKTYANCVLVDDTILQVACYLNLKKAVETLLDNGADPTLTTTKNKKTPLEITISRGFYRIFHVLINNDNVHIKSNDLLIELLHRVSKVKEPQRRYFKACYDAYLSSKKKPDVNLPTDKGVTPLEYAIKYCSQDLILDLLKHGASLALRTSSDNPNLLVEFIDSSTLKKHLDQCLEVDLHYLKCNDDKESLKIYYNYKSLMPPPLKVKTDENFKSTNSITSQKFTSNISKLHEIVKIEEENPLIDENGYEIQAEMETILCICNNPDLKHLINHPVITSLIFMKWRQISWFYNINRLRLITMFILFLLQALSFHTIHGNLSIILIFIRFFMLFFLLLQMGVIASGGLLGTSVLYFSLNDLPELICYILILTLPPIWGRSLSALVVFFLSFRLLFTLGEQTTHVQMFKVVTYNFFGVLFTYMILVFGYAVSLYTLITENVSEKSLSTSNSNDTDEINTKSLKTLGLSLYKSFLILAGDFWTVPLQPLIPVVSDILFVIFVLIVPINLLNFLGGLAVSDVQQIQQEAKLSGLKSQIKLITSLESDLIGNENQFQGKSIFSRISFKIKKKIQKLIQCRQGKQSFAKEICLFPYVLENYKLTVYPNQQGRIEIRKDDIKKLSNNCLSGLPFVSSIINKSVLRLDQHVTSQTHLLMKEKKEALIRGNEELSRLRYLEESIEVVKNGQRNLLKKVDSLLAKIETISKR